MSCSALIRSIDLERKARSITNDQFERLTGLCESTWRAVRKRGYGDRRTILAASIALGFNPTTGERIDALQFREQAHYALKRGVEDEPNREKLQALLEMGCKAKYYQDIGALPWF